MSFAGQLDKTVSIQGFTKGAPDGMGGYLPGSWAPIYKKIKAAFVITTLRFQGEQILAYGKKNVFAEVFIYLEYLSGIKEGQRVHWESKVYEINFVAPWQEKERFMKLACVEVGRQI